MSASKACFILSVLLIPLFLGCDESPPPTPSSSTSADATAQEKPQGSKYTAELAQRLHDHVVAEASEMNLPPASAEQLGSQIADVMDATLLGVIEQYDEAAQAWGGKFMHDLSGTSEDVQRAVDQQRGMWFDKDSPFSIIFCDSTRAEVEIIHGRAGASRSLPHETGGSTITPSKYRFDVNPSDLDDGTNPVAIIRIPVTRQNGLQHDVSYIFVWWPEKAIWVPDHSRVNGPQPRPGAYF